MAKTNNKDETAAFANISLSQAILAPLLSVFKAQVHAARAFLNFLLQIGTPHIQTNEKGEPTFSSDKEELYTQTFRFRRANEKNEEEVIEIKIPTLSLIPISPLDIDSAEFEFDFRVEDLHRHTQIQKSEEETVKNEKNYDRFYRPWYLIDEPINFKGNVAPRRGVESSTSSSQIMKIKIKLSRQPIPAGLDKLLTSFHQNISISISEGSPENNVSQ